VTVAGTDTEVDERLYDLLDRSQLCINRNGQTAKTRRFVVTTGATREHRLGVFNNNVNSVGRAFTERYFFCQEGDTFRPAIPVEGRRYRSVGLRTFQDKVISRMPHLPRLSLGACVNTWSGQKRKLYEAAWLSLVKDPVCKDDARLHSFVKFEKQKLDKAPRIINPRSPRYNLELARYLKHAEKHFFVAINAAMGSHTKATVIKGFDADDSAAIIREKWDRFGKPVAIGIDASKFDMHVSVPALKYEHTFYKRLFPGSKMLPWLLKQQLRNHGRAFCDDGNVSFSMIGTRSSGDINTSLGNCIIMCALVYDYMHHVGVDFELANNGDDAVIICESRSLVNVVGGLSNWFRHRGFAMVVEDPVYEFEELEFCQTRPVWVGQGWRMVRNWDAVITKDPMCLIGIQSDKVLRKWYGAVGECGRILNAGVPVHMSFYKAYERHGEKAREKFIKHIFKNTSMLQNMGRKQRCEVVTPQARASYYFAFGVLPDFQQALEATMERFTIGPLSMCPVPRSQLDLEPGLMFIE